MTKSILFLLMILGGVFCFSVDEPRGRKRINEVRKINGKKPIEKPTKKHMIVIFSLWTFFCLMLVIYCTPNLPLF